MKYYDLDLLQNNPTLRGVGVGIRVNSMGDRGIKTKMANVLIFVIVACDQRSLTLLLQLAEASDDN